MSTWFAASNITPADPNSLQDVVPVGGTYSDLNDGDKAIVMIRNVVTAYTYDSTSALTESLPQVVTSTGNAGNGRWILSEIATKGQNGFATAIGPQSDSLATIGVVGTTFTLTHVADYDFYINGVVYRKTANETVEITDMIGNHIVYFDSEGTLQIQAPGGSAKTIILDNCIVAMIYWDGDAAILLFDERHGNSMSPATHYHMHECIGALYEAGLGLSGFDIDGSGDDLTAAQFDINSGEFHDEDIAIKPATELNARIDTFYQLGTTWKKLTAGAGLPVAAGTIGTTLDYNNLNGASWELLAVTSGRYVLTHYFVTNDVLSDNYIIGIMGQNEYTNIVAARAGAEDELATLILGGLPLQEILPIASVLWQTTTTYANAVKARTISPGPGETYVDWRTSTITGAGVSVSDHENLAGLLGGAALDHYHLTSAQHTDLTDGGDATLHDHDGITENTAARHTQNTDTKIIVANTEVTITDAGSGSIDNKVDGSSVVDITASGLRIGNGGSRVLSIVDEDDMTSDSATALATQQSIKAYVDTEKPNSNSIINGDFNIWQRGTSFVAIANGTYTADRFSYHKVGDMVHTVSRDTDVPTQAESGHKSSYSLKVDCTTVDSSIADGDYCSISHKLEGYSMQAIMGNWATISFWVKATKTGIYCFAMRNSAGDKTWISEYTVSVSDTWEKKTITVNFSDSSGTWLYTNGVGLICTWALATGSTFQSTADSWLATNDWATSNQVNACDNTANNFLLSQVKMEEGETATPYRSRLFSEELALCQRYFQKAIDDDMFAGYAYSTTQAFITIPFKVTLRAEPSTTFVVPTDIKVWYNSAQGTCTSASVNLTSVESVNVIVVCSAAPFTQGDGVLGFINGSAEIWFDAEL